MVHRQHFRSWCLALLALSVLLSCCLGRPQLTGGSAPSLEQSAAGSFAQAAATPLWAEAVAQGTAAANLAQTAQTATDWDAVTVAWAEALQALQAIPAGSPQRVFAQRKAREYVQNLAIAQQQAERRSAPRLFPSLGSAILDEQLGLYLSYVATLGPPDVLIVGSSRALQGIDPQGLQQGLAAQQKSGLKIYNFGVNGATAQVVSFVLRQVLTPEQLPRLVIWADGSRAFNSARFDRTFAEVLASPGYRAVRSGQLPTWAADPTDAVTLPVGALTGQGFLAVGEQFEPQRYYQQFPRVSGRYDIFYNPFGLDGVQSLSLEAVAAFLQTRQIPLIVVNLPLNGDYLDAVRLGYERQFQQYLQRQAQRYGFTLIDLLEQWRDQNQFFADPSHLNARGALELGRQLARHPRLAWAQLLPAPASTQPAE